MLFRSNGILTHIYKKNGFEKAIYAQNDAFFLKNISNTFHGRDIFAPLAGHIANGIELDKFGSPTKEFKLLDIPPLIVNENFIKGNFIFSDSFGNLTSNIPYHVLKNKKIKAIKFSDNILNKIQSCYEENKSGFSAVINSFEHLEIALYKDNAEDKLKNYKNMEIIIEFA